MVTNLWEIGSLAPGQTASLTLPAFTLTTAEKKVVAWSALQSPVDPDSQPNQSIPSNCTPTQDDEAVWTINLGQTLQNGTGGRIGDLSTFEKLTNLDAFALFPNPAGESVFLKLPASEVATSVSIFNQVGILEKAFSFPKIGKEAVELDLSDVKNGVYFLKIETAGQRAVVKKLVVSRLY